MAEFDKYGQISFDITGLTAAGWQKSDSIQRFVAKNFRALSDNPLDVAVARAKKTADDALQMVITYNKDIERQILMMASQLEQQVDLKLTDNTDSSIKYGNVGVTSPVNAHMISTVTKGLYSKDVLATLTKEAKMLGLPAPMRVGKGGQFRITLPVTAEEYEDLQSKGQSGIKKFILDKLPEYAAAQRKYIKDKKELQAKELEDSIEGRLPSSENSNEELNPKERLEKGAQSSVARQLLGRFFGIQAILKLIHVTVDAFKKAFESYAERAKETFEANKNAAGLGIPAAKLEALGWSEHKLEVPSGSFLNMMSTVRSKFGNAAKLDDNAVKTMALYMGSGVANMIGTGELTPYEQSVLAYNSFVDALNNKKHPIWGRKGASEQQILEDARNILGEDAYNILLASKAKSGDKEAYQSFEELMDMGLGYIQPKLTEKSDIGFHNIVNELKTNNDLLIEAIGRHLRPIMLLLDKIFTATVNAFTRSYETGQLLAIKAPVIMEMRSRAEREYASLDKSFAPITGSERSAMLKAAEDIGSMDRLSVDINKVSSALATIAESDASTDPRDVLNAFQILGEAKDDTRIKEYFVGMSANNKNLLYKLYMNAMNSLKRHYANELRTKKFSVAEAKTATNFEDWMSLHMAEDDAWKGMVDFFALAGLVSASDTSSIYTADDRYKVLAYTAFQSMQNNVTDAELRGKIIDKWFESHPNMMMPENLVNAISNPNNTIKVENAVNGVVTVRLLNSEGKVILNTPFPVQEANNMTNSSHGMGESK